ncbi:MAG: ferric reductase-like transmembrane domain-containing protein, partial [Gemmatimonadaceae bacterium]|nr:ferric reductase-like transmembrane domain-containing protein [Acetobacteraceae bacterium]
MIIARQARSGLIWATLAAALTVPVVVAAASPLLAWRDPVYIVAGFAGVVALAMLLVQPLLAAGYLPGLRLRFGRRLHAWVGAGLVAAVTIHVAALWLTSPPDVVDALLFSSPTAFSVWGVVAMWAVFAAALVAALRGRMRLRLVVWRLIHIGLAVVI